MAFTLNSVFKSLQLSNLIFGDLTVAVDYLIFKSIQ